MPNAIQSIIRRSTRKDDEPLNIISFPTHEAHHTLLSKTGHNFYLLQGEGIKPWVSTYRQVPSGTFLLDPNLKNKQLADYRNYDLILEQNKGCQYAIAKQLSVQLQLPMICLTHFLPPPNYNKHNLKMYKEASGHYNVFITEYSREKWGYSEEDALVIRHGVDTELFKPEIKPREDWVLCVCNDYVQRSWAVGFDIFQQVTGYPGSQLLKWKVLGDTKGFSQAAKNTEDLVDNYQKCGVFLNTSKVSPIPMALLEAAAVGCPIVSTDNCAIPELITHGENGFLSNDPEKLRGYCKQLLQDKDRAKKMGENARQTILEKFTLEKFVCEWDNLFRKAVA